jgi:hypothetical protein
MGIAEKCAAGREAVDVRCFDVRMSAQTSDIVIEIIDGNEENVWSNRSVTNRVVEDQGYKDRKHPPSGNMNREMKVHVRLD